MKKESNRRKEKNVNQTINGIRLEMKRTNDEVSAFSKEKTWEYWKDVY